MIKTSVVERFANGQTIITEGIISTKAYIILRGEVKVTKRHGDKNIVIGILKEGDIFGEMGLIGDIERTASVSAVGDVNLGIIDKQRFNKLLNEMPEEARLIVNALMERLKKTTEKLAHFAIQFDNVRRTMNSISTKAEDES